MSQTENNSFKQPFKATYEETAALLKNMAALPGFYARSSEKKNILYFYQSSNSHTRPVFALRLPYLMPTPEHPELFDLGAYVRKLPDYPPDYVLVLLRAGMGALAFFEEGQLQSHKVIRKYMVRKKQGKAQLKHLHDKGKSKLGSRIRLAQSRRFAEEIVLKLQEWEIDERGEQIWFTSSDILLNMLFEAKNRCPFEKNDLRLRKIPKHIQTPDLKSLKDIGQFLQESKGRLYEERFYLEDFF